MASFIGASSKEPDSGPRRAGAPSVSQPKGKATKEDEQDVILLVQGVYGGVAALTGFQGWAFSDQEAEAVAGPAARILARHKNLQGAVREFADPAALIIALGIPTVARYSIYREYVRALAQAKAQGYQQQQQRPQPQPQPQPQEADFVAGPGTIYKNGFGPEIARISTL